MELPFQWVLTLTTLIRALRETLFSEIDHPRPYEMHCGLFSVSRVTSLFHQFSWRHDVAHN